MSFRSLTDVVGEFGMKIHGVIHCGAHVGHEYEEYLRIGIKNFMFFEPVGKIFSILKNNVPIQYAINKAVGNFNGRIRINVDDHIEGQSSSILAPKLHLQRYPGTTFGSMEDVEIIRLDDFVEKKTDFNFMNIDVQGYEIEVLRGAEKLLHNIQYINTEVNCAELYEKCPMIEDIDDFLKPYRFTRRLTQWWPGEQWGDALYIK